MAIVATAVVCAAMVALVAAGTVVENVNNHLASGKKGPLVVLIRHGFSDHNVLMQKVWGNGLCGKTCTRRVLGMTAAMSLTMLCVATSL
jgi:hypothetical protein